MSDSVLRIDSPDASKWTEAICSLDGQVPALAEANDLVFRVKVARGRERLRVHSRHGRAYWHPDVGLWVRYSCGFNWRGAPSKSKRRTITTAASLAELINSEMVPALLASIGDDANSLFASLSNSVGSTGSDLTVENLLEAQQRLVIQLPDD